MDIQRPQTLVEQEAARLFDALIDNKPLPAEV